MKNLLHEHPSEEVRAAAIRLMDALSMWNRSTGRENVVIIKDSIGCEYRALSGSPPPDEISDQHMLEAFKNATADQNPSEEVREAIRLMDALSTWNRTTGVVIIKDSEYRAPPPDEIKNATSDQNPS